jgi:hypothetical protein
VTTNRQLNIKLKEADSPAKLANQLLWVLFFVLIHKILLQKLAGK